MPAHRVASHRIAIASHWQRPAPCDATLRCGPQGFDFEIDHTGGKAVSCAGGLLPCLHGPCAFFRFDEMKGRALTE